MDAIEFKPLYLAPYIDAATTYPNNEILCDFFIHDHMHMRVISYDMDPSARYITVTISLFLFTCQ